MAQARVATTRRQPCYSLPHLPAFVLEPLAAHQAVPHHAERAAPRRRPAHARRGGDVDAPLDPSATREVHGVRARGQLVDSAGGGDAMDPGGKVKGAVGRQHTARPAGRATGTG
jgi:hypothetical protein